MWITGQKNVAKVHCLWSIVDIHCEKCWWLLPIWWGMSWKVYFEWLFLLYTDLSFLYTCGTQVLKYRLKMPQVPPTPPHPHSTPTPQNLPLKCKKEHIGKSPSKTFRRLGFISCLFSLLRRRLMLGLALMFRIYKKSLWKHVTCIVSCQGDVQLGGPLPVGPSKEVSCKLCFIHYSSHVI